MAATTKRSLWWWITAILAPIGLIGGPFALADMLSGIVKWNGWIGYLVNLWSEKFAEPFRTALGYMLGWVHLPAPPMWLANYLALGVLLVSGYVRSHQLVEMDIEPVDTKINYDRRTPDPEDTKWKRLRHSLKLIVYRIIFAPIYVLAVLLGIVLWPLAAFYLLRTIRPVFREDNSYRGRGMRRYTIQMLLIVFGPFAFFLILWVINLFVGGST